MDFFGKVPAFDCDLPVMPSSDPSDHPWSAHKLYPVPDRDCPETCVAKQSVNDAARSVGHEVGQHSIGSPTSPSIPTSRRKPEAFVVVPDLQVRTNVCLINADGIAPSERAIKELNAFGGVAITTVNLDMNIGELTKIAVTIMKLDQASLTH